MIIDTYVEALDDLRELQGRGEGLGYSSLLDDEQEDPLDDLSPTRANSCAGGDTARCTV